MPSIEELEQRHREAQNAQFAAWEALQVAKNPPPGPESSIMIYHTRGSYVTMTVKDLALALKVPVSKILDPDMGVKYAGSAIEATIEDDIIPEWFEQNDPEIDEDNWSVTLQKS